MRQTIKKHTDFAQTENDSVFGTPYFVAVARPAKLDAGQYGIRATKKTLKRAHDRNFAKRRIRALVREFDETMSPKNDYIFIVRAAIIDAGFSNIRESMKYALKRLEVTGKR
ncbi:MAG: ribonuclease P protein component [Alphaproteobacteria bacterium]|nr:ribonuclease P protein component [Alphaproteobacteria bacterium]